MAVFHSKGNIFILFCPGVCQLAGGSDLSAKDIRHGIAALRAGLANVQNGIDARNFFQKAQIHGRAAIDHQHKFGVIGGAKGDGRLFFLRNIVVAGLQLPVAALACLAAENIHTAIGDLHLCDGRAGRHAIIVEEHIHDGADLQKIQPLFLFFPVGFVGLCVESLVILDPFFRQDLKAPIFHTLQNGHGVALIDFAGAGAALDGSLCACAVKGHLFRGKGQHAVVFQQHDTLAGRIIGHLPIFDLPLIGRFFPMRPCQKFHNRTSSRFLLLYHINSQKQRENRNLQIIV